LYGLADLACSNGDLSFREFIFTVLHFFVERAFFHVLHDQVNKLGIVEECVQLGDVGVAEVQLQLDL
jgi:hypothetical protein